MDSSSTPHASNPAAPAHDDDTPFHRGEVAVQRRAGVAESILPWARKVVRPYMLQQHRDFYTAQPFAVLAVRDDGGRPWATVLAGDDGPGLVASPTDTALVFSRGLDSDDPASSGFAPGADIGVLGIELETRRRNRLSTSVRSFRGPGSGGGFELAVRQAFGNCPQHIRPRRWRIAPRGELERPAPAEVRADLTPELRRWIDSADTFFVATGFTGDGADAKVPHPSVGMDASHRGGQPGFARTSSPTEVAFGDFAGNHHFNTLGNLELDPRAGVTFVDFATGSLLQITATATVDYDTDAAAARFFPGAERTVRFHVDSVVVRRRALPIRWDREPLARELTVAAVEHESDGVKSFYFVPTDGHPLEPFAPGQHLPLSVTLSLDSGGRARAERTYSLSGPPGAPFYRVTVKRESHGLVSRHLHDIVAVGDVVRASAPAGDFVAPPGSGPLVLASAGVGVTPFAPILHAAAGTARRVVLVHGARNAGSQPLGDELRAIAEAAPNVTVLTLLSRPGRGDDDVVRGAETGRVSAAALVRLAEDDSGLSADFMLCGPSQFMADLTTGLAEAGVDARRVHQESFGA